MSPTLQFGRPEWSFSPSPLGSKSCSQKHRERNDGSEHRRPAHHTRTTRSFLCWRPERCHKKRWTEIKSNQIWMIVLEHAARLVKKLRWTDLVFARLVLTPMQNLLFDWSSGSWGCWRPLDLEVAGNRCPADVTTVHIFTRPELSVSL